jgi:hypothetical protein
MRIKEGVYLEQEYFGIFIIKKADCGCLYLTVDGDTWHEVDVDKFKNRIGKDCDYLGEL